MKEEHVIQEGHVIQTSDGCCIWSTMSDTEIRAWRRFFDDEQEEMEQEEMEQEEMEQEEMFTYQAIRVRVVKVEDEK